jgi:hypothetical protein
MALEKLRSRHADTQEAMRVEMRAAKEVLQLSMAAAPRLEVDSNEENDSRYPHVRCARDLTPSERGGGAGEALGDDGSVRSVPSAGSLSSISFPGGFDLSSALESTQVLQVTFVVDHSSHSTLASNALTWRACSGTIQLDGRDMRAVSCAY